MLRVTISRMDTRCNFEVAHNVACNVAPRMRALTVNISETFFFGLL